MYFWRYNWSSRVLGVLFSGPNVGTTDEHAPLPMEGNSATNRSFNKIIIRCVMDDSEVMQWC